jgi:hypothetical protein
MPVRKRGGRKTKLKASPIAPTIEPPALVVVKAPEIADKVKRVRKRVVRKPPAKASPLPPEAGVPMALAAATPEQASEIRAEQLLGVSGGLAPQKPVKKGAEAAIGLKIPQILLEGDEPAPPEVTGPGQKFILGPAPRAALPQPAKTMLPESYGTGRLLLAVRDPHWLYAHWDLTPQQQRQYNALSGDRHLVVRVFSGAIGTRPVKEVHLHPESRHWFIHADRAETRYLAELGYYQTGRQWVTIATSAPTETPPDTVSTDQTVRFATVPAQVRLTQLAALTKQAIPADLSPPDATRERALAELVGLYLARQDSGSSVAITELVQGQDEQEVSAAQLALPGPLGGEAEHVSSPLGAAEQPTRGFWFSLNAELIVYGATEPDASVTVGGRSISLRSDGTFSCRFSLPDGDHTVTVSAVSAQGELRQAELKFSRRTEHQAKVGAAPQDPSLEPPAADTP